jgi:DNA-binding protein HU-beta
MTTPGYPGGASNGLLLFGLTTAFLFAMAQICGVGRRQRFFFERFKRTWVTRIIGFWHNPELPMTKTELQSALGEATQTDKRTAGVFLDTLSDIAYKEIKKNGEFVLPGFGKLVKQKRKARTGFNPKTQQKIKIPAKTVVKFRVAKAAKDGVLGVKK